jgi:hypothetical protein
VYLLIADGWSGSGNADPEDDPTAGTGNRHNSRALYVRVGGDCLNGHVVTHELTHSLGGVIPGAPHNDGTGHCTDGQEILCQDTAVLACPDPLEIRLLDCGRDDYFGVTPRGSWLPTHWNMATDSLYLDVAGSVAPLTSVPPLPPQYLTAVDIQGTSVALTFRRPAETRGITDYQVLSGTSVVATIPAQLNQGTVRITGLSANTQRTIDRSVPGGQCGGDPPVGGFNTIDVPNHQFHRYRRSAHVRCCHGTDQ